MRYRSIVPGVFLRRKNRFEADVSVDGSIQNVHVCNTGRCRELLLPGATIFLSEAENPARKTRYDLVAVEKQRPGKEPLLINMDSQAPNTVVAEWLAREAPFGPDAVIRREVSFGSSRFDFFIRTEDRQIFLEVKGCTLEEDGVALFPDAPTLRGTKHLRELAACTSQGYEGWVVLLIQMRPVRYFQPNTAMDPAFASAMREAADAGVHVIALDCIVRPDEITAGTPVEVRLR